jgi:hypothetical protein
MTRKEKRQGPYQAAVYGDLLEKGTETGVELEESAGAERREIPDPDAFVVGSTTGAWG